MGDSPDTANDLPWADGAEEAPDDRPAAADLEAARQTALFGAVPDSNEAPQPVETSSAEIGGSPSDLPSTETAQPYRVLARKYRPQTFAELIGQDAMVQTLGNAIARERLAHAFLMTGVRGVGKTSTARLIAKALNCIGPDGQGGPTIDPCGQCEPCVAIAEGRHIDVIEMDAASHTGVDDMRDIIEAVRYAAVSARYKIYIIDEVHMLSRSAFNAMLKTLEEPPPHVKFIFATTEVEKLPVTVLSRTQRFDLRRIPTALLTEHFAKICQLEGVAAEDEALAMIARAAEGSVRDGLSILDQAIAHADMEADGETMGAVSAQRVRAMLGLADKSAQQRVLAAILEGDPVTLLDGLDEQYALGVEPLALMRSLMDLANRIAVTQVGRGEADAPTEDDRKVLADWAERLSPAQLHRLWQLLLKGHDEVRQAPDPLVAAQMALLRMLHAADMPDPGQLAKQIEEMAANGANLAGVGGSVSIRGGDPAPTALVWPDVIAKIEADGNHLAASQMRLQVRVILLEPGKLVFSREDRFSDPILPDVRDALYRAYGERWAVEEAGDGGSPTLIEREAAAEQEAAAAILDDPLVKAAFAAFPDAEIIDDDTAPDRRQNWSKSA